MIFGQKGEFVHFFFKLLDKCATIFLTLKIKGDRMIIDMIEKCRERRNEIENKFYQMAAYSDDIPALEELSEKMIATELLLIRLEKQKVERMNCQEVNAFIC